MKPLEENARIKQVGYLGNGETDINVYVDIIDKNIIFDESIKKLDVNILENILNNAKKEIIKGGY